jgi:hypothetical protein
MTRTHIIAADGTRFVQVGQGARMTRRILAAAFLIITALFLSAAVIGLHRAEIAPATPSHTDMTTLRNAERAHGKGNCALEWNETQNAFEVICS